MGDFELLVFLVLVAISQLDAMLIPVGLAVAALISAAPLDFEPVAL